MQFVNNNIEFREFISEENEKVGKGSPCFKQSVEAVIVTKDGQQIAGNNNINNNVGSCPREAQGYQSGEGYHLCKEVCNQNSHAEVTAINSAKEQGIDIEGATLYLRNHTYCCDNCLLEMNNAKIKDVFVLLEDNKVNHYDLVKMRSKQNKKQKNSSTKSLVQ